MAKHHYPRRAQAEAAALLVHGSNGVEGRDYLITEVAECRTPDGRLLPREFIYESFASAKERVHRAG